MFFFSLEKPFLYPKNCQTFFLINLAEESEGKETSNFWPKSWTNPFAKNANFSTSKYQLICRLEKDFCVRNVSEHSFWTIWTRKSKVSKLQIFDPKYELLCKKWKFCNFLIPLFFSLEKLIFYQEHYQTLFMMKLAEKSEGKETSNFWPKSCIH